MRCRPELVPVEKETEVVFRLDVLLCICVIILLLYQEVWHIYVLFELVLAGGINCTVDEFFMV